MIRLVIGLLIAGMTYACQAQVYVAQFPPNPGVMPGGGWQFTAGSNFGDPPGPRAWTNGKYGGIPKFNATDLYRLPGPTGPLNAAVVSSAGLLGAAGAVGRCVIGLNPVCAVGTAAWLAYDKYRARPPEGEGYVCGGVPCVFPSGQFDYDPGQAPTNQTMTRHRCGTVSVVYGGYAYSTTSYLAACEALKTLVAGSYTSGSVPDSTCGAAGCYRHRSVGDFCGGTATAPAGINTKEWLTWNGSGANVPSSWTCRGFSGGDNPQQVTEQGCPASTDPFNPAYSIPAGQPVGPDGKCPTARYNHVPRTPEQVADIINNFPPELPNADWGRAVSDAIDLGGQKAPASLTGSGPAQTTGSPVTTSSPTPGGGTTTTTTTGTTNYTYNNTTNNYPSITYATTNNYTTNTCTGGGSCTTSSGSNPGPTTGEPAQDPEDPCVKNPGALQCLKVGEPGTEKPTWETKEIVYEPETIDLPAQCPAPWTGTFKGKPWVVSFTPACDQAWIIKAALLSIVGFGCMLLLSREVS